MNFGQALASLLAGRSISNTEWQRPGMSLSIQERTGMVTERFIVRSYANGVCEVYTPTQSDILATTWSVIGVDKPATEASNAQPASTPLLQHAG